jgi:hypothetical protein
MEQLDYNLQFRWFVGLSMDDKVWDHSVFSKNQERFLDSDLAAAFFARILEQAKTAKLLSDEHFTVDGTLIEAWASLKSFRPKDAPPPEGGSEQLTGALLDRLTHHAHILTMNGESFRFRESMSKKGG